MKKLILSLIALTAIIGVSHAASSIPAFDAPGRLPLNTSVYVDMYRQDAGRRGNKADEARYDKEHNFAFGYEKGWSEAKQPGSSKDIAPVWYTSPGFNEGFKRGKEDAAKSSQPHINIDNFYKYWADKQR